MLAGYKAFLASGDFIYVREPMKADDHFAIASRLSRARSAVRARTPSSSLICHSRSTGLDAPLRMAPGDLVVFPGGAAHHLCSAPTPEDEQPDARHQAGLHFCQ